MAAGSFSGYLAISASGSGPGGRVAAEDLQSQWHHREIADYYAEEGYMVLAPGLFWCQ